MKRLYASIGMSLIAGLVGGAMSRAFFLGDSAVLAQGPRNEDAKVIRAERIELVNNRGVPLAVLEVGYSPAIPAGSPMLTMKSEDVLQNQERKVVISTGTSSMSVGDTDSLIFGAGMIMVRNTRGTAILP